MPHEDGTKGPIILWVDYGYEGWKPTSFNTIEEALTAPHYGNTFLITRIVKYKIKEEV